MFTFMSNINGGEKADEEETYWVFVKLRCFSSMLPSMPKREFMSINVDDTTLGEYVELLRVLTC